MAAAIPMLEQPSMRIVRQGHQLEDKGELLTEEGLRTGAKEGKARCSCGKESEELRSTAARKRWHKEHCTEVLTTWQGEPLPLEL